MTRADGGADSGSECLYCTHSVPDARAAWVEFCEQMSLHHHVTIDDIHRPNWVPPQGETT